MKMATRIWKGVGLVLMVCLFMLAQVVTAPAAPTPAGGKVLKMHVLTPTENFDPGRFTAAFTSVWIRAVYDNLIDYKPGEWPKLVPELATKYEVSPDKLSYTFHLKHGVQWQKGYGELTSEDVKFTVERVLDPATKAPYRSVFEPVIKSIETPDKYTVKFTLKVPDPAFLYKLAPWRPGFIVCKKAVEKFGDAYGKSAEATVGCGPFELIEWIPKQRAILQRFEGYHGKKAKLQRLELLEIIDETTAVLALQKGEIDIAIPRVRENLPVLSKDPNLNIIKGPSGYIMGCVAFNVEHPALKDVRVRRAMAYALDKDLIVKKVVGDLGVRACGFLTPGAYEAALGCKDLPQYPYDLKKAKALMAEAGYPNGFKIKYCDINQKPWVDLAPVLQAYWKAIGIDVELEIVPGTEWISRLYKAETPAFEFSIGTRPPEPSIMLYSMFHSSSSRPGMNAMLYKGVDAELDKAITTRNDGERIDLYKKIQKKIVDDSVIIPLFFEVQAVAARKNVMLGVNEKDGKLTCPYTHLFWLEDIDIK
jgi:peptide/nickel transport system substrate-binding protein